MPFPFDDLRTFLDECEQEGMLVKVKKEVDWDLEAGAIARRLAEMGRGKAMAEGGSSSVLFEKVKDYPKGFRLAAQIVGGIDRAAMAYGYDYKGKHSSVIRAELADIAMKGLRKLIKPVLVDAKDAPCKQNKMIGDEVDLYKFPVPMIHDGDGGRYIATWAFIATKDPDSDWVNWGVYRAMLHDKKTAGGLLEYFQDIGRHYQKYEAKNQPMPFAIVIGSDPLSFSMGASPVPIGMSEMDVVGGMRGKPLPVVKCETNDLPVPAGAEIVIEGVVPPRKRVIEGPYGEYTGYRAAERARRPIYRVTAVTYRDDPILTFQSTGTYLTDFGSNFTTAAMAVETLRRVGIQARCNLLPETGYTMMVVAVKNPSPNIATMVKNTLTSQMGAMSVWTYKFIIVNDDIDIYDPGEVLWAISTRVHPRRGIIVSDEMMGPLTAFASLEERQKRNAPHATFDGTWPLDWDPITAVPTVACFKALYPQELQDKVLQSWKGYGFK